ncbi:MAG: hypothetical protein JW838_11115 [Spirochaetes bacterium]|nr:hypothetical protein [Spirochaetota bacterium]
MNKDRKRARKKTDVELVVELLEREGFTPITPEQERLPEYRDFMNEIALRKKRIEAKLGKRL